jgi:hypothetical protein
MPSTFSVEIQKLPCQRRHRLLLSAGSLLDASQKSEMLQRVKLSQLIDTWRARPRPGRMAAEIQGA